MSYGNIIIKKVGIFVYVGIHSEMKIYPGCRPRKIDGSGNLWGRPMFSSGHHVADMMMMIHHTSIGRYLLTSQGTV